MIRRYQKKLGYGDENMPQKSTLDKDDLKKLTLKELKVLLGCGYRGLDYRILMHERARRILVEKKEKKNERRNKKN